ncbi:MAG: outer membrane beta-barrel domain-containing protein [Myxococcaceae bacterium]
MKRNVSVLFVLTAVLLSQAAFGQELIEKVVVRNRLYSMSGKFEAGLNVGLTLMSRLTDNININLGVAYNLDDTLGFELRGGYGISRHTGLANQIAEDFAANESIKTADDLTELWEMTANGAIGIRWAPIYGKISLMAELPVHFQAYVWLGAGGAMLTRESIVYCVSGGGKVCNQYLQEDKFSPVATAAIGARFFATPNHSIKLELRDWSYPDAYRWKIDRAAAMAGRETGEDFPNPGIINLVQFDVGYSYIF